MSMFSEIHHESTAEDLLKVLDLAIKTNNPAIINFIKENIYPLWLGHMGDVYRKLTEREKNISEFYEKDLHLNFIKK